MRIAIANWHRTVIGGAEGYLQSVIPALAARSHSIGFLHGYRTDDQTTLDTSGCVDEWWCYASLGLSETLRRMEAWRPDFVYVHCLDSHEVEAAILDRFPAFLFAHGYNGLCISSRKCFAVPSIQPCARPLGPQCLAVYHLRRCGGLNPITTLQAYGDQMARKRLLPGYSSVLVASRHMQSELVRNGVPFENLRIAPLPLTSSTAGVRPRLSHDGRLLFLGRLIDLKGAEILLKALPLAENLLGHKLTLRIAGRGEAEAQLRRYVAAHNLDVQFVGWVDGDARNELLRTTGLLVVPSLWPEPFGLVGIEAGQFGVPAAAFDSGGISDWLEPGYSGELAPADPPAAQGLAAAIARALRDPQHYQKLSAGAIEVAGRHRMERHVDALEEAFARKGVDCHVRS